ncbi:MAG: class I SAM-dependent methyltransferase [Xanthomonadales bacterium]|nr:class I SAM-dependent methyltransferase [Xanthomonadales bacterium]
MSVTIENVQLRPASLVAGEPAALELEFQVGGSLVFDLDCVVEWFPGAETAPAVAMALREVGVDVSWLPAGRYRVTWSVPRLSLPGEEGRLVATVHYQLGGTRHHERKVLDVRIEGEPSPGPLAPGWHVESLGDTVALDQLSWQRGHEDWFYRHFDHAARTIISYLLGDSPLLKGRVLDVGCGDGITDLGIALRCQPEELVGIDPFEGYKRLPQIAAKNHLVLETLPDNLRFLPASGNDIPFADDSFDVVLSWGSLEHIAGGYDRTLAEIKRVLRDGGLFFAHPGLYYSNFGHHLGEFCEEPFFHLTRSHEALRDLVLNNQPKYMDRAGEFATSEQYWQWFNELNPMTVSGFEQELRALGFEFYRVALRTEDLIEYHHPALQQYAMQDLATVELYLSAWNRK